MATSLAAVNVPVYTLAGVPPLPQPKAAAADGADLSLATEVLPAPPPLARVEQATVPKKDPRKPAPILSYLPSHDPSTTYSNPYGVVPLQASRAEGSPSEPEGRRRKRVRVDKEGGGLVSRGSLRGSLNAASSMLEPAVIAGDTVMGDATLDPAGDAAVDSDAPVLPEVETMPTSRATTVPPDSAPVPAIAPAPAQANGRSTRPSRRDKSKGKERDDTGGDIKVKEEAAAGVLPPADGPSTLLRNQDHCSACRSLGSLVYCDGCTRAYHLWCLDPPMEATDLPEGENRWFCPTCNLTKHVQPKPPPSFLGPLISQLQSVPPIEFQLPDDIRTHFKNVGSNMRGGYVDTSTLKPPRLNRLGQLEERDPYRTKDRNGAVVLCFRCGTSAFSAPTPPPAAMTGPNASKRPRRAAAEKPGGGSEGDWRSIVTCDYCSSHWHLDCLDPPLTLMPPLDKKWMCPNHVDHTLNIKPRIPKNNSAPIEITRPGMVNNGNVEIIEDDTSYADRVETDIVFINGKRYRIPERIIKLDFWNRLNHVQPFEPVSPPLSTTSSLTSLSELEDVEMEGPLSLPAASVAVGVNASPATTGLREDMSSWNVEDLRGALLLLDLQQAKQQQSQQQQQQPQQSVPSPPIIKTEPAPPPRITLPPRATVISTSVTPPQPTPAPVAPTKPTPKKTPAKKAGAKSSAPAKSSTPAKATPVGHPITLKATPVGQSIALVASAGQSTSTMSVAPVLDPTASVAVTLPASSSAPPAEGGRRQPGRASKNQVTYTLPPLEDPNGPASKPKRTSTRPRHAARSRMSPKPLTAALAAAPKTPASAHAPASNGSAAVNGTTGTGQTTATSSSSLKIRLPRLSDLRAQPPAAVEETTNPQSKVRRSIRRQDSSSGTGTSVDE